MNYDVLTVGNAIIDVILGIDDQSPYVRLNKQEKELRITSGQKIPVETPGSFPGGNACNVAVGLMRAGIKSAILAQMADDEFADHIKDILSKEGVGLEYVQRAEGATVLNVAINFKGDRTIFTHHVNQRHDFNLENAHAAMIYLTSLGNQWHHVYKMVGEYVQKNDARLAFNPGSAQLQEGVGSFAFLLPLTTVLFVNKEEAEIIAGEKGSVPHLLQAIHAKGVKVVSITSGEMGSYAIDDRGTIYQKDAVVCPVVERTGAGDAYASGFLALYLQTGDVERSMSWGLHNSASVIGQAGAQSGLLTKKELEQRV